MTWDIGAIEKQLVIPPDPIPPTPSTDVHVQIKAGLSVILHHRRKPNLKVDITVDKNATVIVETI